MMGQKKIKRAIAISGVIGGMVLLKATPVYAVENIEDNIDYPQVENINVRMASKGQVVNVDGTYLRIRSSATTESSVLGTMIEGSKFDIISKSGQWYRVQYNSITGYVHGDYVQEINSISTEPVLYYGKVNAEPNLRIRSGSSINSSVLGYVSDNATVTIIGSENGWYKIKYNSGYGYVHGDYVLVSGKEDNSENIITPDTSAGGSDEVMCQGTVINVEGSNLRVRKGPSTNVAVLGYLLNNSTVDITGKEGNWYKINFKGSVGYVSEDYISINGQASSDSSTSNQSSYEQKYNIILNAMKEQIGAPYVWAGSGEYLTNDLLDELKLRYPSEAAEGEYSYAEQFVNRGYRAFDCSGLMQWGFAQAGINIGRSTYNQIHNGVEVSLNDVRPGDLIFTANLDHVGMYVGNGQWIESPYAGKNIRISNVPWSSVTRARRIL